MLNMSETKKRYMLRVDKELCKGCMLCIEFCPKGVLDLSDELNKKGSPYSYPKKMDKCIGCRACTLVCPDTCIELFEDEQEEQ